MENLTKPTNTATMQLGSNYPERVISNPLDDDYIDLDVSLRTARRSSKTFLKEPRGSY